MDNELPPTGPEPDEHTFHPPYDPPMDGGSYACYTRHQTPVTITREQVRQFGQLGATWAEIEAFYGINRHVIAKTFASAYRLGVTEQNLSLRNKLLKKAMEGNLTALMFVAKNRLHMSENGPTHTNDPDKKDTRINPRLEIEHDAAPKRPFASLSRKEKLALLKQVVDEDMAITIDPVSGEMVPEDQS